jgi:hypothetical protein
MTVYVDDARNPFRRMVMCHMFALDLGELHAMADTIGLSRRHFQDPKAVGKISWPHYDIGKGKRALAVKAGAVEVDRYQFAAMGNAIRFRYLGAAGRGRDPLAFLSGHREFERVQAWMKAEGAL